MTATTPPFDDSPFLLKNGDSYLRWRERKLAHYPASVDELLVEVDDPRHLSRAEYGAMAESIAKCNMVLYASACGDDPDKAIPRRLGERFGLERLNSNWLADDDGITSLTVNPEGTRNLYIPYTDRPIKWHTDGYYNPPGEQIHGVLLHCVYPAATGGENGLLDPEIAYIRLRDEDPDYIRALMDPDAMTIPPGTDMNGQPRGASVGPVFTLSPWGTLHMRYTARKRNIEWKGDPATQTAVSRLESLLDSDLPEIFRARLESGMGLICNNVLHDRRAFEDSADSRRLLYRARYFDRVTPLSTQVTG